MKKNDKFIGTCTSYTFEGLGVIKHENMPVFVKNMILNETGEIVITKVLKNYAFGRCLNLINKSNYPQLEYYTITKNNKNNYVNIAFSKYQETNFFKVEMNKSNNKNICDVVIDPGHGGDDPGAVNGEYKEKDINLIYAKLIKEELDNLGLKVKLTRDLDVSPGYYGIGSRTGIPYECKNKLMLSMFLL